MVENCLQVLHCIKFGICRTVPIPHTCFSPSGTFPGFGDWNYEQKMECENIRICSSLLPPNVCSLAFCYFGWTSVRQE